MFSLLLRINDVSSYIKESDICDDLGGDMMCFLAGKKLICKYLDGCRAL
jgi:hypothetical protein